MKTLLIFFTLASVGNLTIIAQEINCKWVKTYVEDPIHENEIYPEFFASDNNNLYSAGYTGSTNNDFDPDTSSYNLTAPYQKKFYVSKFDLDGNHQWSSVFGSSKLSQFSFYSRLEGIALTNNENIYVYGTFLDTIFYFLQNIFRH